MTLFMTEPKHLLHVFSTFGVGGPEVRSCNLINYFGNRYRHTIIAMDDNYECKSKLQQMTSVEFHPVVNDKSSLSNNLKTFISVLNKLKPDLLLTYNFGAVEWGAANAWVNRTPHFHWEEGFGPEEVTQQFKRRIYVRRIFLARTKKIVAVSRSLEKIAHNEWKFSPHKVAYIPNGVNLPKFSQSRGENIDETVVIGTVAKLRPEKNIARMIRCFAVASQDCKAKLVIVGAGTEAKALQALVTKLNISLKVEFTGYQNDPSEFVKSFDIMAISSDTEQMPIAVLEAMAAGCPVVGTDVGDIREMLAESNRSYLCAASDETAFTNNLKSLMSNKPLRNAIGADNLIRCAAYFDEQVMFEKYQNLYDLKIL